MVELENHKIKVLVIGLGSMGRRRIRLMKNNFPFVNIIGVDTNPQRQIQTFTEFGVKTFSSIGDACNDAAQNAAFVCTPPGTLRSPSRNPCAGT